MLSALFGATWCQPLHRLQACTTYNGDDSANSIHNVFSPPPLFLQAPVSFAKRGERVSPAFELRIRAVPVPSRECQLRSKSSFEDEAAPIPPGGLVRPRGGLRPRPRLRRSLQQPGGAGVLESEVRQLRKDFFKKVLCCTVFARRPRFGKGVLSAARAAAKKFASSSPSRPRAPAASVPEAARRQQKPPQPLLQPQQPQQQFPTLYPPVPTSVPATTTTSASASTSVPVYYPPGTAPAAPTTPTAATTTTLKPASYTSHIVPFPAAAKKQKKRVPLPKKKKGLLLPSSAAKLISARKLQKLYPGMQRICFFSSATLGKCNRFFPFVPEIAGLKQQQQQRVLYYVPSFMGTVAQPHNLWLLHANQVAV